MLRVAKGRAGGSAIVNSYQVQAQGREVKGNLYIVEGRAGGWASMSGKRGERQEGGAAVRWWEVERVREERQKADGEGVLVWGIWR